MIWLVSVSIFIILSQVLRRYWAITKSLTYYTLFDTILDRIWIVVFDN